MQANLEHVVDKVDSPSYSESEPELGDTASAQEPEFEPMGILQEKDATPEKRPGDVAGKIMALAGLGVFTIYSWALVLSNDPVSMKWFALHPTLQSLGVLLFGLGILVLQPTSMNQPKAKARGFAFHQSLILFCGVPALVIGTLAIIRQKFDHESEHFTTWHGTLGIIAVSWLVLQIVLGGGSVWNKGRLFGSNPKRIYKYHRASGYLLFPLFLFVIYLGGGWSKWTSNVGSKPLVIIAYVVGPMAALVGVLSRARCVILSLHGPFA
ncbi:hypothetical protein SISSUDRAFT_1125922 [Sistotremastrum suecicum HHB10207 ss-3]|uniref:Cytochrome b561 domain-containing protein n=1 Tax=Sistotremastrum suecicum HHB10207 ss-3 TaxID=1314776 RepID=A0A166GT81_9AGAM|nr:hypothetical protein SISSUDRAFT_1125922 [Sistotremastrum suecicum HHB10207 ss-3]